MKWSLVAVFLSTSLVSGIASAEGGPKAEEDGKPKIQFDQTVYDFGMTSMVQSVTGTFTFRNSGSGVLQVQKPSTSCGCTVAGVQPETLQPGEKGELVFTLNVGGIRGHSEKHITVPSNDPENPTIKLTVRADVKQIFEANPQQIMIGDIRSGAANSSTVQLRRTDGKKLEITRIETTSDMVKAQFVQEENPDDQSAEVAVNVVGEGQPRRFGEQVKVFTDDTAQPSFTISVFGRLIGDVSLTPEALFWGITDVERWDTNQNEAMTTRRVVVTSSKEELPLEVLNLSSSLPDVNVELVALEPGKSYAVVAKLPKAPKDSERGTISFDTNIPSQPKVVVPVTINVLRR